MKNKKTIVMCTLLLAIVLLGIGTIAYFRRTVNGNITGNTGNLVLIVNEANAELNETFTITLRRSEEEEFIMPDDSGVFDLNIDSTGSSSDVAISINISRTNLPENLRFYLDANHTEELTTYGTIIKKADTMTKTVPIYWFWDGSISDEADSEFINTTISANISVSATIAKTLYNTLMSFDKTADTDVNFNLSASETNGQGLMLMNSTRNDEYPIVYYRGDVVDNNVIFAGYCWLIVRTTETGGVKLIYNGNVNSDGSCNYYAGYNGEYLGAFINKENYSFNENDNSPVYVGYMYNDVDYTYSKTALTTDYVAHLSDNTVDQETGRHVQNLKDSTIKGVADDWYEANILGKPEESLLEDTIWCNDRSVISETYTIENYANGTNYEFNFAARTRLIENPNTKTPSLACTRDMDKFTVDSTNGNGDLDYPIGLLTADELIFASAYEASSRTYLTSSTWSFWLLSPENFEGNSAVWYFNYRGSFGVRVSESLGVRPTISLNKQTYILSGDGTLATPYHVG